MTINSRRVLSGNRQIVIAWDCINLSGTGDSQRDSRESIRTNHSQLTPLFL